MATNIHFNNFTNLPEQSLAEDLIIESIKIYGHDVWYCPRTLAEVDRVYNEDSRSEYNTSYQVEMYIKNVEGFEGEGNFLSKFNIQIRDQITFTIANKTYRETIGDFENSIRPREGDLIYMPLTEKIYVIKFAEHERPVFYQFGAITCYDLVCELWEYSNEKLNTGVPYIDKWGTLYTLAAQTADGLQRDANGDIIIDEDTGRPTGVASTWNPDNVFADNQVFDTKAFQIIDWSEQDPFSEGGTY